MLSELFKIQVPEELLLLYGDYDPEGLAAFKRVLIEENRMASSAVSHSLEDLLDVMEEDGRENDTLLMNARAVLDEYKGATGDVAQRLADHVRSYLAQLLQLVNTEYPELVGSREVRDATEVLSNPHLSASDVAQTNPAQEVNEPGPTPEDPIDPETLANAPADKVDSLGEVTGSAPEKRTDGGQTGPEHDTVEEPRRVASLKNEDNADKNLSQAETGEHGDSFNRTGFDALDEKATESKNKTGKGKK